MNILVKVIAACAILVGQQYLVLGEIPGDIFTNCGGVFEESTGVLDTPNFPGPYPTPIYCEWLVHAPPGKKIVLYFTQNYMRNSIYLSSYEYYQDLNLYVGREELGQIFWEHDLTFLVVYKPYVLLQFSIESIANRHLRVIDHLLDVYGFNITYEFVDTQDTLSKQTCSVKTCSYLGNCLASADFSDYSCQCFDKFFGENCQYGPFCDPDNGINLCSNGGQCKYFFGSLINQCECPDGFEGAYCEMPSGEVNESIAATECGALKCSHNCETDFTGQSHCYCPEGYTMRDDNETCARIERYRFDVAVEFQGAIRIPPVNEVADIKKQIFDTLKSNGIQTVANLEIHGFRNSSQTTILEFHFYCFASEVSSVPGALKSLTDQDDLGGYPLKKTQPVFAKNPELALSEVINYDPHATLRGKMLTLVCAAKGSSKMVFRWFKDNVRVDTSLTTRNAWETLVPHTVHGMLLSVLNIDSVMPIDQGVFTCKVEDFGNIVEGNVAVTVNNYPRVQLDPMSVSVNKGKTVTFKCLSPDDSWQQFTYEWFKNGMKISANSKDEYAEDMYPTGVRLVVMEVKQNAEYTCKVTNEAGPANVSAYVFVISDNSTAQFCPRTYVGEVMWSNTSGGHFDVKRCPTEQGGEYTRLGTIDYGYARRHCECDTNARTCRWSEPNFSKCQSLQLIRTYDELELLRNGYQQTNLSDIFDDLHTFILSKNENAILYSGDMDMVAGILKELVSHMKTFPQLVKRDKKRIEAKRLVDLIGAILTRSSMATSDEKSEIMVGPSIVQTVHNLITGAIEELSFSSPLQESSQEFGMREEYLTEVPCLICDTDYTQNMQSSETASGVKLKAYTIRSQYLADLLSYRDQMNNLNTRLEFTPASVMYSVADINEDITNFGIPTARIIINHDNDIRVARSNTTVCLKWQFEVRNSYSGRWTRDGCITIESHRDRTVCECKLPGHFIAGMIPSNASDTSQILMAKEINVPLISGYCISLVFILVAFFVYMKTYSRLNIEIHTVYLSFVLSILLGTIFRVVCLTYTSASQSLNQFLGGSLTFSFYVAITSLCLEMFHLFVITYNIKFIRLTRLKFFLFCWGIPFVLIIPTTLVSTFLDLKNPYSCHALCWLYIDTSEFLVFAFIIGLEFCIYMLLLILCVFSLRKWTEEWRYAEKRTYVKAIAKNSILLIALILTMCSGIDLEPWSNKPQVACNITFQLILCILVLITRCILNKHIRFLCVRICFGTPRRDSNTKDNVESKSFRAFVEPKNVSNVLISQEEDNVSKYYDEVNRTKYTKERKKMLSSLLGSGSGSGSGGSTAEMTVSYNSSSGGSKESTSPSVLMIDPFTHSGTDCGILINDCSKSSSSVGASGSVKDDIQPTLEIADTNYNFEEEKRRQADNHKRSFSDISTDIRVKIKNVDPMFEVHSSALNTLSFTRIDHDFGNLVTQTDRGENIKTEVLPRTLQSEKEDIHMKKCQRKRSSSGLLNIHSEVQIDMAFNEQQLQNNSDCESECNSESNVNDEAIELVADSVDSSDREDGDSSCSSKLLSSES